MMNNPRNLDNRIEENTLWAMDFKKHLFTYLKQISKLSTDVYVDNFFDDKRNKKNIK